MKNPKIELIQGDCLDYMKKLPDKAFQLAIVDPPYAVGASDGRFGGRKNRTCYNKLKHYKNKDQVPGKEYFDELFRVSENQIIWGANYYPQYLYHSGWIVWDKNKPKTTPLSDCELAFQSLDKMVKKVNVSWFGFTKHDTGGHSKHRMHPNQKPVVLYKWILKNYAKDGDKILDTHGGSRSLAIACYEMGFPHVSIELDTEYHETSKIRFLEAKKQIQLPF